MCVYRYVYAYINTYIYIHLFIYIYVFLLVFTFIHMSTALSMQVLSLRRPAAGRGLALICPCEDVHSTVLKLAAPMLAILARS